MKIVLFFSCLILLSFVSCKKNLKVETDATFSNITSTSVDLRVTGSVSNSNKKYAWGFSYDTNIVMDVPGMNYEHPGLTKSADFTNTLTGLSPSTKYYVRPYCLVDGEDYHLTKEIPDFTTAP